MSQPKFAKQIEESERTAEIKKTIHKHNIEKYSNETLTKEIYQRTLNQNEFLKQENFSQNQELQELYKKLKLYKRLFITSAILALIFAIFLYYNLETLWEFILGAVLGWYIHKKYISRY